jgi:hypothetical protein
MIRNDHSASRFDPGPGAVKDACVAQDIKRGQYLASIMDCTGKVGAPRRPAGLQRLVVAFNLLAGLVFALCLRRYMGRG